MKEIYNMDIIHLAPLSSFTSVGRKKKDKKNTTLPAVFGVYIHWFLHVAVPNSTRLEIQ